VFNTVDSIGEIKSPEPYIVLGENKEGVKSPNPIIVFGKIEGVETPEPIVVSKKGKHDIAVGNMRSDRAFIDFVTSLHK
jgi:hypothetical protein